jgi:hypothetical protein
VLVTGAGIAMVFAAVPRLLMEAVPAERTSEATGLMAVLRSVGQAVGAQLIVFILALSTVIDPDSGAKFPSAAAYQTGFVYITVTTAVAFALALALPRTRVAAQPAAVAAH